MAVRVTHVRMVPGGSLHEHIESVKWENVSAGTTGSSTVAEMVKYIDGGNKAYTLEQGVRAEIVVVRPTYGRPYIRTQADGRLTNNLLELPRY